MRRTPIVLIVILLVAAHLPAGETSVLLSEDFTGNAVPLNAALASEIVRDSKSPAGAHLRCEMRESGLLFKEYRSIKATGSGSDVAFQFRLEADKDSGFEVRLQHDLGGGVGEISVTLTSTDVRVSSEGFIPAVAGYAKLSAPVALDTWRRCAVRCNDEQLIVFLDGKDSLKPLVTAQMPPVPLTGLNFYAEKSKRFSLANLAVSEGGAAQAFIGAAKINRVPYIATYYVKPKVAVAEPAVINYYVTDWEHKDYLRSDASEFFTIDYWVNGVRQTVQNVKAGDQSITLGTLAKGKVLFALQATDRHGAKSHRLYCEFLVIDPSDENIPADKVLHPDVNKFGIASDDTRPVETTAGLTQLLKSAREQGYRKVVLPKGRYRIDENATVQMASGITLDMNGSTFKLNPNAKSGCLMLEFVNCFDSHVVNGTFEGDFHEHDYKNAPHNSEWVNCLSISEGSEYCSVENVTIKDITGYGTCTNHRHSFSRSQDVGTFEPGDIDADGREIPSDVRTTCKKFVPVDEFVKTHRFLQLGIYLGYQGNPAGHWVYKAHFYDGDKKYIETIEGYLYRRLYPPPTAKFARFTLLSTARPTNLAAYNFRAPYNCAFINIKHENIRCVGMALSGFVNFLVEGCTFENCGQKMARCAFDAEDGWDMMQDLTFRKNLFGTNPANEFLTCGGHNFVMENNTMKAYIWERTNGYVFRHNTLKSAEYRVGRAMRSGYVRVQNNTHQAAVSMRMTAPEADREYCIRDNACPAGISMSGRNVYAFRCQITGGTVSGRAVECEILNTNTGGGWFDIQNSRIADSMFKCSGLGVAARISGSQISRTKFMTQGAALVLEGNTVTEAECAAGGDWSDHHELILRKNVWTTSAPHLVHVGNSFRSIVLHGNTINASHPQFSVVQLANPVKSRRQLVELRENRMQAAGGLAVKAERVPAPPCELNVNLIQNEYSKLGRFSSNLNGAAAVKITEK
ncbi:MAG TPA: hypothetical protein VEK08_09210 [Planctomycetota bacterium]|nr:hypothetical protein [Planctomycetota bacterium]